VPVIKYSQALGDDPRGLFFLWRIAAYRMRYSIGLFRGLVIAECLICRARLWLAPSRPEPTSGRLLLRISLRGIIAHLGKKWPWLVVRVTDQGLRRRIAYRNLPSNYSTLGQIGWRSRGLARKEALAGLPRRPGRSEKRETVISDLGGSIARSESQGKIGDDLRAWKEKRPWLNSEKRPGPQEENWYGHQSSKEL
jgi:hypothetical protein